MLYIVRHLKIISGKSTFESEKIKGFGLTFTPVEYEYLDKNVQKFQKNVDIDKDLKITRTHGLIKILSRSDSESDSNFTYNEHLNT